MDPAVAVFVKTPGHSPIKTRLAGELGSALAEEWHRRAAACVAEVVHASDVTGYWAVAEPGAMDDPIWAGLPRLPQGDGTLGQRLARVHGELVRRHGAALLIGADMPQLECRQLERAAEWLASGSPRRVLGRARDGGFWLFGSNRVHPVERWISVRYSESDTAERLRDVIGGTHWLTLETRTDLDRPSDLQQVLTELRAVRRPSPGQRSLIPWLESRIESAA